MVRVGKWLYKFIKCATIDRRFWADIGVDMKKYKRYLLIGIALMMMCLTGCGKELYELTAEEEDIIIHSAAYLVAKHNIQQKDGVNGVSIPESFEEETQSSEVETEAPNGGVATDGQTDGSTELSNDAIALAELIGHEEDLKVTYEGSYVANSYMEGSAYFVDAEAGKTFYVMKFKLTNITDADVKVNNAAKSPIVKLVSDVATVKSEVTFLTSDFSTYQGTIKAGGSVETILLFEVSETVAEQITNPALQITIGKSTKNIKL